MSELSEAVHELDRILRANGQGEKGARLVSALDAIGEPGGPAALNRLVAAGMGSLWDVAVSPDPAVWSRFRDRLDRVYMLTKSGAVGRTD